MLKRRYRLKDRRIIKAAYRSRYRASSQDLIIHSQANHLTHNRLVVVVNTKVAKRATVRNRIRRRLHGRLADLWNRLGSGYDLLVRVKHDISHLPAEELNRQLTICLKQLRILK